ncbi:acyltransferase family protein [Paenibacillus endoradicis]|uniref:acyltransferase family protein n=1 Tax=Paenibacillus endoradicis TaxID=2972487 RepID=UPI0021590E36|nr:acyltransferase [Paenibacillus endoradicis]MCR8659824.1 acyltransferase [Paenibacillus endoradicis]
MSINKNRIEGLDLLRFAAAFSVLFYHYFFIGPLEGFWPNTQFIEFFHFGDFGVDIFFIISGLVICISSEGRSARQFIKARFLRIMPALFVCSLITALSSSMLPGVSPKEIFVRWLASLTLFPQLFGSELLSGVYWTLQTEIKFYIIVAILIALRLWRNNYLRYIMPIWLIVSLVNSFYLHNGYLEKILITEYAGHFIAGILLYQIYKKEKTSFMPLGFLLSGILIWNHCVGFESWIGGTFNQSYSMIGTFLIAPVCITIVYYVSGITSVPLPSSLLKLLGGMSYPLYLLHGDFGFFLRAMTDRWILIKYPSASTFLTNIVVVITAIVLSLAISAVVVRYIEPRVRDLFKRILRVPLLKK